MRLEPFSAHASQATLDDLRDRLARTRWPDQIGGSALSVASLNASAYWAGSFDWRVAEARLNALPQFRAVVERTGLHLVYARSSVPGAVPLLMINVWPSSVFEYLDIIPRLTASGFRVIAPALPGFGYSDRLTQLGMNATRIADLFTALMAGLGYDHFLAHGSDMGAGVVEQMRQRHADQLLGIHFSNVYWRYLLPRIPRRRSRPIWGEYRAGDSLRAPR